jgi:hypothetical protein
MPFRRASFPNQRVGLSRTRVPDPLLESSRAIRVVVTANDQVKILGHLQQSEPEPIATTDELLED